MSNEINFIVCKDDICHFNGMSLINDFFTVRIFSDSISITPGKAEPSPIRHIFELNEDHACQDEKFLTIFKEKCDNKETHFLLYEGVYYQKED